MMLSRRNFLLGSTAALGATALPAAAVEQFGWTEFGVPLYFQGYPIFIDGGFPPPSPELITLFEQRLAAAQEAYDAAMKPVWNEMFSSGTDRGPGGLAALFSDDECSSTAGTES